MTWTPYAFTELLGTAVVLVLVVRARRHERADVARTFTALLAAIGVWMLGAALSHLTTGLAPKILAWKLAYLGVVTVSPAALGLVLQATGRGHWIEARRVLAVAALPALVLGLAWTNEWHGLLWRRTWLLEVPGATVLGTERGPAFWIHVTYAYALLLAATALLVEHYARGGAARRRESAIVLSGMAAPWLVNAVQLAGFEPLPHLDLTPHAFLLTAVLFSVGLLNRDLLAVMRVARDQVIDGMSDGLVVVDLTNRLVDVNAAARRILDLGELQAAGQPIQQCLAHHPELIELFRGAIDGRSEIALESAGRRHAYDLQLSPVLAREGAVTSRVLVLRDITERKVAEARIRELAYSDGLTGLPNREAFQGRLRAALDASRRYGRTLGLLFVDLDGFKRVNDTLGHGAGDQLLREVARRFSRCVRPSDLVGRPDSPEEAPALSRLGGDEFTVLLSEIADDRDAARVAQRLLDSLRAPISVAGQEMVVSASIGISLHPGDGHDAESLLRCADAAMYHAKHAGRGHYEFFSRSLNEADARRMRLEGELVRALEREELSLRYQPVRDATSGATVACEALLRWDHPELGVISPADFVPIAEESGMIVAIGEWVLRQACGDAIAWLRSGARPLRVCVNVSGHQLRRSEFATTVATVLDETGLDASLLELELTESTVMQDDAPTNHALRTLDERGVGLALDDFGTGYSSLSYLRRFPLDHVKIDRSFVREIPDNADDAALTSAIIAMAHSLRIGVIAEGVESVEQAEFLRARGCDLLQGYLLGRPTRFDSFGRFLERTKPED